MTATHPALVIVRGIPGSGKSYLTTRLADAIGYDKVVILDPDAIDKSSDAFTQFSARLTAEGVEEKFHAFRFLRQQGYDAILNNQIIIWNQAFIDFNGFKITVDRMMEYAEQHSIDLPLLVIEVEIDPAVARARITDRASSGGHDVPNDKFEQFVSQYESFASNGFATVTIDGADDIDTSLQTLLDHEVFRAN
jgi:predicted ABC-type ATPase